MPKIAYVNKTFRGPRLERIEQANAIIEEYQEQGFTLTLRQLYYQLVARKQSENTTKAYKALGATLTNARLAGLVDWSAIEDYGRNLRALSHWSGPSEILAASARQYREDLWAGQAVRPEVWIEKEALAGVFEAVCNRWRVPFFCCKGWASISEVWAAGSQRLANCVKQGQNPVILHFADHDPSGLDMTRDLQERLALFLGRKLDVHRLALNSDQLNDLRPPPNPTRGVDRRYPEYKTEHGEDSWELDAVDPVALAGLVEAEIASMLDNAAWRGAMASERRQRGLLQNLADDWSAISRGQ